MSKKIPLTADEMRRKAGETTKRKYGKDHFKKMGKKGQQSILAKYGPDYYKKLAQKGLKARLEKLKKKKEEELKDDE